MPFRISPRVVSSFNPAITPLESWIKRGGPVMVKCGSTMTPDGLFRHLGRTKPGRGSARLGSLAVLGAGEGVPEPLDQHAALVVDKADKLARDGVVLGIQSALDHRGGSGRLEKTGTMHR